MKRHTGKLMAKAKKCEVWATDHGRFWVQSPSGSRYLLHLENGIPVCHCTWKQYHPGKMCSHEIALEAWFQQNAGYRVSLFGTEEDAKRQHKKGWKYEEDLDGNGIWVVLRKDDNWHVRKHEMDEHANATIWRK